MGEAEDFERQLEEADERPAVLKRRISVLAKARLADREHLDLLDDDFDILVDKIRALERGQIFLVLLVSILLTAVWELRRGDG